MPKENRNPPAKAGAPAVAMLAESNAIRAELSAKLDEQNAMLREVLALLTPAPETEETETKSKTKK